MYREIITSKSFKTREGELRIPIFKPSFYMDYCSERDRKLFFRLYNNDVIFKSFMNKVPSLVGIGSKIKNDIKKLNEIILSEKKLKLLDYKLDNYWGIQDINDYHNFMKFLNFPEENNILEKDISKSTVEAIVVKIGDNLHFFPNGEGFLNILGVYLCAGYSPYLLGIVSGPLMRFFQKYINENLVLSYVKNPLQKVEGTIDARLGKLEKIYKDIDYQKKLTH